MMHQKVSIFSTYKSSTDLAQKVKKDLAMRLSLLPAGKPP
jgi:hypothetical protein